MATEKWDFVAIQALTEGTLTDPVNKMIAAGIPVISIDTLIAPYDQANVHTRLTPDNNFMGTSVTQALVDAIGGEGKMVMSPRPPRFSSAQRPSKTLESVVEKISQLNILYNTP